MRIYRSYLSDSRDFIAALLQEAIDDGLIEPVHAHTIADATVVIALHFVGPGSERSDDITAAEALSQAYSVLMAGLRAKTRATTPLNS